MANDIRWEIRGNDGVVKARVGSLEYNDEWMSERYVTVTVESPCPIDFAIGDYLIYRDERFEINYDPGKIKSAPQYKKGDAFKYENVKFNSLADELTRCDFLDVVPGDNQLHFTGLPKFSFYGGVKALADRIQANLDRAYGEGAWEVILGAEAPTQSQINNPTPSGSAQSLELNVAVDNIKVAGALEILVNQFKTYYTIKGRTITIGAAGVPADHLFKYGKGNGLYEIEENAEADQAIVTRLRAYGSTRNIPHRYYNSLTDADGEKLIPDNMAVQYLMLPSFPYSTLDPYIDSANISALGVREGTIFFDGSGDLEEIYPSIEGMTAEELKASGVSCQSSGELDVLVSAEQMSDDGVGVVNDQRSTTNDQGASGAGYEGGGTTTAEPATFKVTIKDIGFDINEHLTSEAAKISFKSGMLGAREFEIVSCERLTINDQLSGYELELNRVYDEDIKLWFPYKDYNAKEGDKFVLLSIRMPEVYIKAAAQRLKERATEWLSKNDYSRSVYAPKIDENFMARQHDAAMASSGAIKSLHDTLCAGMQLLFEDEDLGIDAAIFIDRLTIIEGEGPVPTYEVVLKEEKTVGRLDKMQNQIDSLAAGYGQGGGYNASQIRSLIAAYGGAMFLSKLKNDRTPYQISSDKGFEVGHFTSGVSGGYFGLDKDGESFAEVGRLWVRVKAFFEELTVIKSSVLAGKQYITPGGGIKCVKVSGVRLQASEEEEEIFLDSEGGRNDLASLQGGFDSYRCYFLSEQDGEETDCKFIVGDQAISESFNAKEGTYNKISNHFYWRAVTEVNNDAYTDENGNHYGYIELSATNCASNSDIPQAGDEICQLGYQGNQASGVSSQFSERQSAMVFSTVDSDSPSMKLFDGINSFSLNDKAIISFGRDNRGVYFRLGNSTATQYFNYSQEEGLKIAGDIIALSTIDGKSLSQYFTDLIPEFEITREDIEEYVNAIVDPRIEGIQDQIDGVIETWFYNGVPTLTNYPASEWDENAKIAHLGDLYYDNTTGTAYRFSKDGNGNYYWNTITDDAITKALAAAKDAQDTADQKRRTFLAQPTPPYDEGDIWVNATYGTQYSNDILRCITPKEKGQSFSISDWTLASKYTDDSALNNFIGSYQGTIGDILNQLDGKAETWYQATDPSTAWTTAEVKLLHKGDLWYNTTNGTTWYWNGSAWQQQDVPDTVFDKIDGKADIFVSKSELMAQGYHANDLWFLEADYTLSDGLQKAGTLAVAKCGRSASEMASNGFHFEDWAKKDRYTDDTLAQQAKDEIGKYEYIKKALHGVSITSGGLFLSSFVQLGEWSHNAGTDEWTMSHIWSGLNGIYNDNPRSPFLWGGGDMVDIFDNDNNRKSVLPESYAKAMIRMDGSAYFGGGAHIFNPDGSGSLANGNIYWGTDGIPTIGSNVIIKVSESESLNTMLSNLSTHMLGINNLFKVEDNNGDLHDLSWAAIDSNQGNIKAIKALVGLYTDSFLSARGLNPDASQGGGIADFDAIVPDLTQWLTTNSYAKTSDIPSSTTYLAEGTNLYFTDARAQSALSGHTSDTAIHVTAQDKATWNGKLDASAYTANDVLSKLLTVDGSGSGLDADTVDGVHNGEVTAKLINYNNSGVVSSQVQFMQKSDGWNPWEAPSQMWHSVIKMCHGNGDTYFSRSLAFNFWNNRIYTHCKNGGNDSGWETLAFLSDNVASASKLSTTSSYSAWGQTFWSNGVPNSISGEISGCTRIRNSVGLNIYLGNADNSGWVCVQDICSHSYAGDSYWSLRTDGTMHIKKIVMGDCEITYDSSAGGLHFTKGIYSDSFVSARGSNPNGGSAGGGGLIQHVYGLGDLNGTYSNGTLTDTFNAYTIQSIYNGLQTHTHPQYLTTSGKAADSDKLDGLDSSAFFQYRGSQSSAIDWNTYGSYLGSWRTTPETFGTADLHAPQNTYQYGLLVNLGTSTKVQMYFPHSTTSRIQTRISWDGSDSQWYSWRQLAYYSDIPTNTNQLTNGAGFITSSAISDMVTKSGAQEISGAKIFSSSIGVKQTAGTGVGISLYGSSNAYVQNYGIMFALTSNFAKHGAVQGDWATYFTMDGAVNRGWIFRHASQGNVASVNAEGKFTGNAFIKSGGTNTQFLMADGSSNGTAYLPLAGGTLSGANNVLSINSSTSNSWIYFLTGNSAKAAVGYYSGLAFLSNEATYARIGITDDGTPQYWTNSAGSSKYTLWHTGNLTNVSQLNNNAGYVTSSGSVAYATSAGNADTVDGVHNGYVTAKFLNYTGSNTLNAQVGFMQQQSGWNDYDAPTQAWYSVMKLAHYNGDNYYCRTLAFDFFSQRIYTGGLSGGGKLDWKTLAFLDDNVASATKLATTRYIWGQGFNGEGNVTGNLTLGSGNSIIGGNSVEILKDHGNANVAVNASNGDLYLGYWHTNNVRFYSGNTSGTGSEKAILLANGNWGIGTTAPSHKLHVVGVIYGSTGIYSDGYVTARGQNSSDARLKEDIRDFNASEIIKALKPKQFRWNAYAKSKFEIFRTDEVQYGLIAQETKPVASWLVDEDMFGDGLWGVKYEKLIPILVKAENEQIFRIDDLEVRVKRLEKENGELRRKIEILERR